MTVHITIDSKQLKKLIIKHIETEFNTTVEEKEIDIEVKTKQNYKADWEHGDFKAELNFKRDAN
jgi:hypothetical protein